MMDRKVYKIPLIRENFSINVVLYDNKSIEELKASLTGTRYESLLKSGRLVPENENGFVIKLDPDESMNIFLNLDSDRDIEDILVHELFHASTELASIVESEEYGARINTLLYREFLPWVKEKKEERTA